MDVLSQFFSLLFRSFVILLPLTTGWLALRRLILSRSANAWIYAATCLFAMATVAGVLPWALGIGSSSALFFLFAAFCPALWIGVIMMCDGSRISIYESSDGDISEPPVFTPRATPKPLVLENPSLPQDPQPVFRHRASTHLQDTSPVPLAPARPAKPEPTERRSLLSVAREMRGNANSEARRPRLLPPPERDELPFLPRT